MGQQRSQFWDTAAALGDGADTYSANQMREMWRAVFTTDRHALESILPGVLNELAVSGSSSPLSVASGKAFVNGIRHASDSAVNVAVPTPSAGTTKHRVVLQAVWGTIQAARVALISSPDGTNSYPALTQNDNSQWEVPLYGVTIDTLGAITLEDQRDPCHYATALIHRRRGGSSTNWISPGSSNYSPGGVKIQCGTATLEWDDNDNSDVTRVTFPTAYTQKPLVRLTILNGGDSTKRKLLTTVESVNTSYCEIRGQRTDSSGDLTTTCAVTWIAKGSE